MQKKEKLIVNILSNLVIIAVVVVIFFLSFSNNIVAVLNSDVSKPIYKGNDEKKQVSLMFNVYWGSEYIDGILETLKKYNVKCTFFIGGMWAEKEVDLLRKIQSEGHELANHGFFHKDHKKLDYDGNKKEILSCESMVYSLTNEKTNLFAPPSGAFSSATLEVAEDLGYKVIMWSKDTIDWRDKDTYIIYKRATKDIQNGDLILMHPTKCTLLALEDILSYYNSINIKAVTVSENIKE